MSLNEKLLRYGKKIKDWSKLINEMWEKRVSNSRDGAEMRSEAKNELRQVYDLD